MNGLLVNCRKHNLKPKVLCQWFYSFVGSIQSVYKVTYEDCVKGKNNWMSVLKKYCMIMDLFTYLLIRQFVIKLLFLNKDWLITFSKNGIILNLVVVRYLCATIWMINVSMKNILMLRFFLIKLRVSSHALRMQTGRYGNNRLPTNERLCIFYLNNIDDEFHFLQKCPCLSRWEKSLFQNILTPDLVCLN